MQKLTEATVAALEATGRDRIIFDGLLSGFAIRITPAGGKLFIAQARAAGVKRRITVGSHPADEGRRGPRRRPPDAR